MLSQPSPDLPGALSIRPWLWELLHRFFHQSPFISSTTQQCTVFRPQSPCFHNHSQPAPGPFLPLFHCLSQVPFHRPCPRYQIAIADADAALTRGKVSLSDHIVCAGAHLSHTERWANLGPQMREIQCVMRFCFMFANGANHCQPQTSPLLL